MRLLVTGIFGTVSVEMFGEEAPDEFATFFRAFYTLFGTHVIFRLLMQHFVGIFASCLCTWMQGARKSHPKHVQE